jgi:DNA-binding NarL/FixJ family response regulator
MRICLASGEPLFRLGLSEVARAGSLQVVGEAADGPGALAVIARHQPDVALIDVGLHGIGGIVLTGQLAKVAPLTRILLLARWSSERNACLTLLAGAHGIALKTAPPEQLLDAIWAVAAGKVCQSREPQRLNVGRAQAACGRRAARGDILLGALSARERQVLSLLLRGEGNRAIAEQLSISERTVASHRTRINRKLHCRGPADIVRLALENGFLPPTSPTTRPPGQQEAERDHGVKAVEDGAGGPADRLHN